MEVQENKRLCPNCNAECGLDAAFCPSCGARIDGMRVCRKCKKKTPEGSEYCIHCGAKKDDAGQRKAKAASRLNIASSALALISAFSSIIFAFFIGADQIIESESSTSKIAICDLYFFFGEAYDSMTASTKFAIGLGTAISALTLLGIAAIAVYLCKTLLDWLNKKEANFLKPAIWAYVFYGASMTLFMWLIGQSVYDEGVTALSIPNGPSIAGLAIAGISLLASLACFKAKEALEIGVGTLLRRLIPALLLCVALFAPLFIFSSGLWKASIDSGSTIEGGFAATWGDVASFKGRRGYETAYWTSVALVSLLIPLLLAYLALCGYMAGRLFFGDGLAGKTTYFGFAAAIALAAYAVINIVFVSVPYSSFVGEAPIFTYINQIGLLVLSAIIAAINALPLIRGKTKGEKAADLQ